MDLFDQHAPVGSLDGEGYGRSGEMKKTQYMLQLLGAPWDPETLKCIIVAVEQGMEMRCGYLNTLEGMLDSQEYRFLSEFGISPSLKEADYTVTGSSGIIAFINARGLGYSLIPKNVNQAATQDYWIDIAITDASPSVEMLVQEQIVGPMSDPGYSADTAVMTAAKEALAPVLDALESQLNTNGPYVIGKYSLADVHWTPLIHLLMLTDAAELVHQRTQIHGWYTSLETRKSNCGQDIVAFSLLPGIEEIRNKKLSHVEISDY